MVAVAKGLRDGRFRSTAGGSFKAWLKLIVQRRVSNHLRKRRLPRLEHGPATDETTRTGVLDRIPAPAQDVIGEIWDEEWAKNLAAVAIERVKHRVIALIRQETTKLRKRMEAEP